MSSIRLHLSDGRVVELAEPTVVGRAPDSPGFELVALDDPDRSASKNHASMRPCGPNAVEVTDLSSTNGTVVTTSRGITTLSARVAVEFEVPFELRCGDALVDVRAGVPSPIAAMAVSVDPVAPVPAIEVAPLPVVEVVSLPTGQAVAASGGLATLAVRQLVVESNGHRRLDRVDLDAHGGELIGVLGTSGAGKSTLIKAIAGADPASGGQILLNGLDVYAHFDSLRHHIGYVPQDDILHPTLSVRQTLEFAARLRLPASTTSGARTARVDEVLAELGLTPRADARVDELSGGQRKRVNVAVELLTSPTLLILDEPTSGLDPGNERIAMELFRSLARNDRVVLVVTHSTDSLDLCDRVILMATGGNKVYDGHISGLSQQFGGKAINEIFAHLERTVDVAALRSPDLGAVVLNPSQPAPPVRSSNPLDRARAADLGLIARQLHILSERYIRVVQSDRRNSLILVSQAGVIAVLMLAVFGADAFVSGTGPSTAGNVLMALALASIYLGASNAVREIVKERPILQRELAVGVSPVAYLGSKLIPLGALTIAQAGALVLVGTIRQGQPDGSATFLPAMTEVFFIVAASGVSALCLGLLISAMSPSPDRAMTILPVVLFAQLLLVGLIFPVSTIGVQQLAWLTAAYWAFGGAAATVDYDRLAACFNVDSECAWLWERSAFHWGVSYLMLCVLGAGALYLAWRAIDRSDPAQVLRHRDGMSA